MAAAANIQDAINACAFAVAATSANPTQSLFDQTTLWIETLFTNDTAIFPNDDDVNARTVRNWSGPTIVARQKIEGTGNTDSGAYSTSQIIDVVFRCLNAVQVANNNGFITQQQEDDVVAAFNAIWC